MERSFRVWTSTSLCPTPSVSHSPSPKLYLPVDLDGRALLRPRASQDDGAFTIWIHTRTPTRRNQDVKFGRFNWRMQARHHSSLRNPEPVHLCLVSPSLTSELRVAVPPHLPHRPLGHLLHVFFGGGGVFRFLMGGWNMCAGGWRVPRPTHARI